MAFSSEDLDRLQRLSDECGSADWASLIEGRDIESGSSFIQVNGGRGEIGDIEISLVPGEGSDLSYPLVGRQDVYAKYQDLIAAARSNLPALIDEVRRLQRETEALRGSAT